MKVSGIVEDVESRQPIAGARVKAGNLMAYTDKLGVYLLKVRRRESVSFDVVAAGYHEKSVTCTTPERRNACDFKLRRIDEPTSQR